MGIVFASTIRCHQTPSIAMSVSNLNSHLCRASLPRRSRSPRRVQTVAVYVL